MYLLTTSTTEHKHSDRWWKTHACLREVEYDLQDNTWQYGVLVQTYPCKLGSRSLPIAIVNAFLQVCSRSSSDFSCIPQFSRDTGSEERMQLYVNL